MRRLATAAAVAASVALPLAGCGSGEDPTVEVPAGGTSTMPTSTTGGDASTTTTAAGSSTTIDQATGAGGPFGTTDFEYASSERALLTAIRHARHADSYRVVFEFKGGIPGTKVAFTQRPVIQDGSGNEVTVAGDQVLSVRFEPASGFDMETSQESYTGPDRITVNDGPVAELVRTGDFEAVLNWVIGVDQGTTFRVTRLDEPPRLVIDLK